MKLLLDENLSSRLVRSLQALYPNSIHVSSEGLDRSDDATIWGFAKSQGFILVSKDSDFYDRSVLFGCPPKVIWLKVGNCPTSAIESLLVLAHPRVKVFHEEKSESCLVLSNKEKLRK
jgi:predicted nuclease of predicted toxin-antitoxin system